MTVFDLQAKLGLDKGNFDKGVRDAESSGKGLSESLGDSFGKIKTAAKAFLTAAIFKEVIDGARELVTEVAAVGDTIDKQSQVLGLSRKAYQEWDYILSQNGANIDSLSASMRTLNNTFIQATEGNKEANDAFAQLGISVHELETMNPEEQFETIVRAMQKLPAGAQKSALAVKLFGRGGMQLLPLLNNTSESIDVLRARAEELGLIMSDDAVNASVEYTDSLDTLKRTFNGLKYSIGAKILPFLTDGMQKITAYAGKLRKAYEEKGLSGVWDTLVEDFRNIPWPTWEQVQTFVEQAWNTIVEGVKGLAKVIFGENVDGEIDWPTWEEIEQAVLTAWGKIVEGVKSLGTRIGKAIFGENVDGEIDWPTWEEVGQFAVKALKGIIKGVKDLGTLVGKAVFGENVDGEIDWPTWDDIKKAVTDAWQAIVDGIKGLATGVGKAIFNDLVEADIDWPTWDDIGSELTSAWNTIVDGVKKLPDLIFGEGSAVSEDIKNAIQWIEDRIKEFVEFLEDPTGSIHKGAANVTADVYEAVTGDSGTAETVRKNMPTLIEYAWDHAFDWWPFAKGDNYVPYDDFPARLHRGEMVLTASQARRYREGDSSGLDMNALVSGVVGAVREGMDGAQVNSYMDSTKVTNKTNSVTGRKLMARRFA